MISGQEFSERVDWDKRLLRGVRSESTKKNVKQVILKGGAAWSTRRNLLAEAHEQVHMVIFEARLLSKAVYLCQVEGLCVYHCSIC